MKTYLPAALAGTALTAAAIAFGAATAHAASPDYVNETAAQATSQLQALGYGVQVNGSSDGDLSACGVTGVNGLTSKPFGTVYVTVDCHDSNN
jgi:nicotinamide mononucleotide (NMN) deamidase PncC